VTVGSDFGSLADDEGNLRADVARFLGEQPPPAAPRAAGRPEPAPAQRYPTQFGPRLAIPRVAVPANWVPVVVIAAALVGLTLGRWSSPKRDHVDSPTNQIVAQSAAIAAPVQAPATAVVNGVNVNLRSGPGLYSPAIWKLGPGDVVRIGEEHDGWFAVETSAGLKGFVFGALLCGASSGQGRPATVVALLRGLVNGAELNLRPGDRVLARLEDEFGATILLPSGTYLRVPPNALAFLD
jgi:SH3-like domain-containing protein